VTTRAAPVAHTLVIATSNHSKLAELRVLLAGLPVNLVAIDEVLRPAPVIVEDGTTFADNATKKARAVAAAAMSLTLADDSGLEVDILSGQPGVRSARFAHERATDAENNAALVTALLGAGDPTDVPEAGAFTARFRCVLALVDPYAPGDEVALAEGVCEGTITTTARGSFGFGYDPLFLVGGSDKTMAELTESEKNSVSHRGRACVAMRPIIERFIRDREVAMGRIAGPTAPA
jgi:XTP/dITP diphosphohydrolase